MQEVHYSNDNVIFTDKECLSSNVQCPIFHHRFLKSSTLVSHSRNGHKNTQLFRNLIASATDSLPSVSIFSNCDDTTMDYIIVNSESTNITDDTGNSISEIDITSETA